MDTTNKKENEKEIKIENKTIKIRGREYKIIKENENTFLKGKRGALYILIQDKDKNGFYFPMSQSPRCCLDGVWLRKDNNIITIYNQ